MVLPFHKRSGRSDDVEDLKSGDIDIIAVARPGLRVPTPLPPPRPLPTPMPPPSVRPSGRPPVLESMTDEVTCLMPAKSITLPPRSSARALPDADDSTRTLLRSGPNTPHSFVPPAPPSSARQLGTLPPQSMSPRALPYAMQIPGPAPLGFQIPAAPPSVAPVSYGVGGVVARGSDPRLDPPGTVITTRTKLLTGRPTLSWGAALIALGVFAGLVTAVLARGDGDSLVDATASFVDPSHASKVAAVSPLAPVAPAAQPQAVAMQPMAPAPLPLAPAAMPMTNAQPAIAPAASPMSAMPATQPVAASPAPMAYAPPAEPKTQPAAAPKPAAVAAPAAPPVQHVAAAPPVARPAPLPKADKPAAPPAEKVAAEKPAKRGPKDDLASAKEAKALADAQLEASLR